MSRTSVFGLGALGGILPILVSLLTVDFATLLDGSSPLTPGNYIGYGVRVSILILLGGIIASLNNEVRSPIALVQLGIAAPALITSYINGGANQNNISALLGSSIVTQARANDAQADGRVQIAGGFMSDIAAGFSIRLDVLDAERRLQETRAETLSPEGDPISIYPPTETESGLGVYCTTPLGRFGPGPENPIGAPCEVPTPAGVLSGSVSE